MPLLSHARTFGHRPDVTRRARFDAGRFPAVAPDVSDTAHTALSLLTASIHAPDSRTARAFLACAVDSLRTALSLAPDSERPALAHSLSLALAGSPRAACLSLAFTLPALTAPPPVLAPVVRIVPSRPVPVTRAERDARGRFVAGRPGSRRDARGRFCRTPAPTRLYRAPPAPWFRRAA